MHKHIHAHTGSLTLTPSYTHKITHLLTNNHLLNRSLPHSLTHTHKHLPTYITTKSSTTAHPGKSVIPTHPPLPTHPLNDPLRTSSSSSIQHAWNHFMFSMLLTRSLPWRQGVRWRWVSKACCREEVPVRQRPAARMVGGEFEGEGEGLEGLMGEVWGGWWAVSWRVIGWVCG